LKKRSDNKKYKVMVHLCQEEEVSILLKVLWWWEELYPQIQPKLPKSAEEFKEREKKREEVVPSAES
jgi:other hect domain ubiquitin protein ligase E3